MTFFQNPFQKKYIPVLIALLLGVAAAAFTHVASNFVAMGLIALFQWVVADRPLTKPFLYGYIGLAAITVSLAIFSLFVGVFGSAVVSGALSLIPLSIVFTRKLA